MYPSVAVQMMTAAQQWLQVGSWREESYVSVRRQGGRRVRAVKPHTAFTARVMEDARVSQSAKGAFPDCIPPFVPTMKLSSPGWADSGVILPHTSWMQNGDTGVIRANWKAMEAYMTWIEAANRDHVWRKQRGADYADWLSVDAPTANPGAATTPKDLLSTAYWAQDATMMAAMAEAIGNADAAEIGRAHV